MLSKTDLPHVMAVINFGTVLALCGGYGAIRRGNRALHRRFMMAAVGLGSIFLVLYLSYHFGAGLAKFGGQGEIRPLYFAILIVHILAAAVASVLVPVVVTRALGGRFEAHKRLALSAWRLWMFVAITGITVYVMTIHLWPYAGGPV